MEGSSRARNYRRYHQEQAGFFTEGITGYVAHLGSIYACLPEYKQRLQATLSTTGALNIQEFHKKVVLEQVSARAGRDSRVHSIITGIQEVFTII